MPKPPKRPTERDALDQLPDPLPEMSKVDDRDFPDAAELAMLLDGLALDEGGSARKPGGTPRQQRKNALAPATRRRGNPMDPREPDTATGRNGDARE